MQHYAASSLDNTPTSPLYTQGMNTDKEKKNKYRLTVQLQKEEEEWIFELRVALLRQHRTLKEFVLEAIEAKNQQERIVKAIPRVKKA